MKAMKTLYLPLLILALLSMVSTKVYAYDIAVENEDGVTIYYNFINDGTELSVSSLYYLSTENFKAYQGSVVIPEKVIYENNTLKVTSIDENAFYVCSSLTSVIIPNSVTSIGNSAFQGSSLSSVAIGNSVTSIGGSAFNGCSNLTSVTIGNSVTSIGGWAFSGCPSLTSVSIPISVTSIGDYAFCACIGLTSVNIPNSVPSIGNGTFEGCSSLTSVTIGNSVTNIGNYAFAECAELINVYCYAENIPIADSDAFENSGIGDATLHVPDASVENYKRASPWSGFGTIVGLEGTAIDAKQLKSMPVLVQAADGQISVEGAPEGTKVAVYDASGVEMGTAISRGGTTLIPTHIAKGSIAIVKIGEKVVKVKRE